MKQIRYSITLDGEGSAYIARDLQDMKESIGTELSNFSEGDPDIPPLHIVHVWKSDEEMDNLREFDGF